MSFPDRKIEMLYHLRDIIIQAENSNDENNKFKYVCDVFECCLQNINIFSDPSLSDLLNCIISKISEGIEVIKSNGILNFEKMTLMRFHSLSSLLLVSFNRNIDLSFFDSIIRSE